MRRGRRRGAVERSSVIGTVALAVGLVGRPGVAQEPAGQGSLTDTIPEAAFAAMVEAGSGLFNGGSCIICHAVGGRGDGRRAPDLTDAEWLHSDGSFEGVLETITWGVRREEMKAVAPRPFQMNPSGGMALPFAERRAIAAYVWSLGHGRQPPKVAAQTEFLRLLERGETEDALALFGRERRAAPDSLLFGERAVNALGYEFLRGEAPETALDLFSLNAELHPDSWNVWDSLAEAHMVAGDRERAVELYEKSLEMNPDNTNAQAKLEELRGR